MNEAYFSNPGSQNIVQIQNFYNFVGPSQSLAQPIIFRHEPDASSLNNESFGQIITPVNVFKNAQQVEKSSSAEDLEKQLSREMTNQIEDIQKKIDRVNETVQICYIASRCGLEYKQLIINNSFLEAIQQLEQQEEVKESSEEDPLSVVRFKGGLQDIINSKNFMLNRAKFVNGEQIYQMMNKTKQKFQRRQYGPKQMNNFTRQQINQFVWKIDQQNQEYQKRVMVVNQHIHSLLRGQQIPSVINEEDNEASVSNKSQFPARISLQSYLLQKPNNSQGILPLQQSFSLSNLMDPQPKPPNLQQSSSLSWCSKSDFKPNSGMDSSYFKRSNNSSFLDVHKRQSSSQPSNPMPIFIINSMKNKPITDPNLVISQEQICQIMKAYKDYKSNLCLSKNSKISLSKGSNIEICEISFNEKQEIQIKDHEKYLTLRELQESSGKSSDQDIDENPSKKDEKVKKQEEEEAQEIIIIDDNDNMSRGFVSNRKLQKKAEQKKIENQIANNSNCAEDKMVLKTLLERIDETDKQKNKKFARDNILSNQCLDEIHEEEGERFSQSLFIKLSDAPSIDSSIVNSFNEKINSGKILSRSRSMQNKSKKIPISPKNKSGDLKTNSNLKSIIFEPKTSCEQPKLKIKSSYDSSSIEVLMKKSGTYESKEQHSHSMEILYNYDEKEKKLLSKVIKMMKPKKQNKIWYNIFLHSEKLDIHKAIDRMAFERNPERQIKVSILDYYSLEKYYGPITFIDGICTIHFHGQRVVPQIEFEEKQNCFSYWKKKWKDIQENHISKTMIEYIQLDQILGIVYGPYSVTFKHYFRKEMRNEKLMKMKNDQWRFITIVTQYQSYDLIMQNIKDAFDFIISINEAQVKQNDYNLRTSIEKINKYSQKQLLKRYKSLNFKVRTIQEFDDDQIVTDDDVEFIRSKLIDNLKSETQIQNNFIKISTNKKLLLFQMTRNKIQSIASELGYSMAQYIMVAIYNTICEWPEDTVEQIDHKILKLNHVQKLMEGHQKLCDLLEALDYSTQKNLQFKKHQIKLAEIPEMDEELRMLELKNFFKANNLFGMKKDDGQFSCISSVHPEPIGVIEKQVSDSLQAQSLLDDHLTHEAQEQDFLGVIIEQNQSYEYSRSSNPLNIPNGRRVSKQLNLIDSGSPKQQRHDLDLESKCSRNKWDQWLKCEKADPEEQKKILDKKLRSLKYLSRIKQRRKTRISIEQQLQKVEDTAKRKGSPNFFRKFKQSLKSLKSRSEFSVTETGSLHPTTELNLAASTRQREIMDFNYHNIDEFTLEKERKDIIKWTKNLYCKEHRIIDTDHNDQRKNDSKYLNINERMIKHLYNQSNEQIFNNQRYIANEIKKINQSRRLQEFRAYPVTSIFRLSTGQVIVNSDYPNHAEMEKTRSLELKKLQMAENKLSAFQLYDEKARISAKANREWKQEYKRQQNLLKKKIEISIQKNEIQTKVQVTQPQIIGGGHRKRQHVPRLDLQQVQNIESSSSSISGSSQTSSSQQSD